MENYGYKIESGIHPKYIIEYFTEISDKAIDDKEFVGNGWIVKLVINETKKHRIILLPSTNIYFYKFNKNTRAFGREMNCCFFVYNKLK